MNRRTLAVLGIVALVVGGVAATASAIENTYWFGGGQVNLALKFKGRRAIQGSGAFESSSLSVYSSQVSLFLPMLDFSSDFIPSGVTLTAQAVNLQADPQAFSKTTVKTLAQTEGPYLSMISAIETFAGPCTVTGVAFTSFLGKSKASYPDFGGLLVNSDSLEMTGKFKAIQNFTRVTGKQTLRFEGVLSGGNDDQAPFKGTITIQFAGQSPQ